METNKSTQFKRGQDAKRKLDDPIEVSENLNAYFSFIIATGAQDSGRVVSLLQKSAESHVDGSRVRSLIDSTLATSFATDSVESFGELLNDVFRTGVHKFSVELPNEMPISVNATVINGQYNILLSSGSRKMIDKFDKNKSAMGRTISGLLLCPVKITTINS